MPSLRRREVDFSNGHCILQNMPAQRSTTGANPLILEQRPRRRARRRALHTRIAGVPRPGIHGRAGPRLDVSPDPTGPCAVEDRCHRRSVHVPLTRRPHKSIKGRADEKPPNHLPVKTVSMKLVDSTALIPVEQKVCLGRVRIRNCRSWDLRFDTGPSRPAKVLKSRFMSSASA